MHFIISLSHNSEQLQSLLFAKNSCILLCIDNLLTQDFLQVLQILRDRYLMGGGVVLRPKPAGNLQKYSLLLKFLKPLNTQKYVHINIYTHTQFQEASI